MIEVYISSDAYNGCGKSCLFKCIMGGIKPQNIFIRFNDELETDYGHIGERVKYLPQDRLIFHQDIVLKILIPYLLVRMFTDPSRIKVHSMRHTSLIINNLNTPP